MVKLRSRHVAVAATIAVAVVASTSALVSSPGSADAAITPATATARAQRTGQTYATNPNGCGFRAGLYLQRLDDDQPELVLHRFDGDVTDDKRITLPGSVDSYYRVVQSQDCTSALVYGDGDGLTAPYVLVDLQSGESNAGELFQPEAQFPNAISALPDGRFVDWIDVGNVAIETFDALTGETIDAWDILGSPGLPAAFSDDGKIYANMGRFNGTNDDTLRLRWFRSGETESFAQTPLDVFPGRNFRVDLSPRGRYAIVEGPVPGAYLSRVVDQDGNTVVDFTDEDRSLRATFVGDDEVILCRFDGAYRSDLAGKETLIEPFPAPTLQQSDGDVPALFSVENSACVEALSSPGILRAFVQRGA